MKAILEPLKGKYYGTKITVLDDNGTKAHIEIWDDGDYTPSKRELETNGYTEKQWEENEMVETGWEDVRLPIRDLDIVSDSHFESKQSYELALKIMDKLNQT